MQFSQLGIYTVTLLVFKGARFKKPTDLRAVTYKWDTANLFVQMRYVSITDYDRAIFRYSCDTLCSISQFSSMWPCLIFSFSKFIA